MHRAYSWLLSSLGINSFLRLFLDAKIYVLNYHSVSSDDANRFQADLYPHVSIDASLFEEHIRLLQRNGHTFMRPKDLITLPLESVHKPTVIYFDDGYKDILAHALPIMQKYGGTATVCATSGLIDRADMLWTITHRAFLLTQDVEAEKREALIVQLKTLRENERESLLEAMYTDAGFIWRPQNQNIFLEWQELATLRDAGWEIASHGVSHANLLELTPEEVKHEVLKSKKRIEEELHEEVVSFSYPHGRWDAGINKALKEAGYKVAMSVGSGLTNPKVCKDLLICLTTVPVKVTDTAYELESKLYTRHFVRP